MKSGLSITNSARHILFCKFSTVTYTVSHNGSVSKAEMVLHLNEYTITYTSQTNGQISI